MDGPLQIEARIDQNAQLSGQLSLWNQQGSHVRRGTLIVIPVGKGLLYAEPIYLQAERSPMPELRIVVLALQDRLAYGPNFETALAALFGNAASTLGSPVASGGAQAARPSQPAAGGAPPVGGSPSAPATTDELIRSAAKDIEDYQAAHLRRKARRSGSAARVVEAEAAGPSEPPVVTAPAQEPGGPQGC